MKRLNLGLMSLILAVTAVVPLESNAAQRRRAVVRHNRVVVRNPATHTRLVVHRGHPVRRVLPTNVVVRSPRRVVTVGEPLVYMPSLAWAPRVAAFPSRDRLVWQDTDEIRSEEGWVDTTFGVDEPGNALFIEIDGRAGLNFAEVAFANGNVQVVDFNELTHGTGVYRLLDFADGRHVKTVRMLAKSVSDETKLAVYLSR